MTQNQTFTSENNIDTFICISALWERYMATLQLYQKVRYDLHSSNQRLMAQLKARHVMNPSKLSLLAESKQEELAYTACQLMLSLFADKDRIVDINEQLVRSISACNSTNFF